MGAAGRRAAGVDSGRPMLPPASPTVRAALSLAGLSAWVVALFVGWAGAGAVHLLLVAAVLLFPWRAARGGTARHDPTDPEDDSP